jgi:hypothetical protein
MHPPASLSLPLQRIAMVTACIAILTSSFDIFLVIEAGGNYRLCQVLVPILLALALLRARHAGETPTLGATPLCFWLTFQVLFIPATNFWPKSLGYCLWLMLNYALLFSFVQLFSDSVAKLKTILRWYVISFALIAIFGIVQLALSLLGLGAPLVTQWLVPDQMARANGFSYEPSYFATYLLIGFVFVGALRRAKSDLLHRRLFLVVYWIVAAGIFASSSRMGIIFFFVDVLLNHLLPWWVVLKNAAKLRLTPAMLKALGPSIAYFGFAFLFATATATVFEENPEIAFRVLAGTGLSDTAAHSVVERADSFGETLTVFLQHPIVGRSLGGMSAAIAENRGETIHSFEDAKTVEGMSVFAEALAASGVIGVVPFVWFVVITIQKPLALARTTPPFYAALLRALVRSLIFAWAILQFNQNVLRPYLWTHLAILATVYATALQAAKKPTRTLESYA